MDVNSTSNTSSNTTSTTTNTSNVDSLFERASRLKLRFATDRGLVSVEELWDIPLTHPRGISLDQLAISLYKQLRDTGDVVSFVDASKPVNPDLTLKFDIVRHVIAVKVAERDARNAAEERRAKKNRIKELISQKQDAALSEKSIEELQAELESLAESL